jgi:hypothetical protein
VDFALYLAACAAGAALGWFTGKLSRSLDAPRWVPSALRIAALAGAVYSCVGQGRSLVLLVTALGFSLGVSLATRPRRTGAASPRPPRGGRRRK